MSSVKRLLAKLLIKIETWRARKECAGAMVYDVPDMRDHPAPRLYNLNGLPDEFNLGEKLKQFNWKRHIQSGNECTAYSKIHQEEIKNTIWNNRLIVLDPLVQWKHQLKTGATNSGGDSLLNSQKEFLKNPQGYPVPGYFRLKYSGDELIEQIKLNLLLRFTPIQTGLKWRTIDGVCNYNKLKETGIYESFIGGKVVGAHAISIRGWTRLGWVIQDSLNNTYGANTEDGVFIVPFEETSSLFRMYSTKDLIDEE